MVTEEVINQHLTNIDEHYANGDFAALFEEAKALYKVSQGKNAYFMGACYINAWGTACDNDMAIIYLKEAAQNNDNYEYACYLAGLAYYRKAEFIEAVTWLSKAEEAGSTNALCFLADASAAYAMNLWNEVRNCILQDQFAQGVDVIKHALMLAIEKYMKAAELAPDTMNNMFWCGFGRTTVLLYNLSTSGCLDLQDINGNTFSSLLSAGMQVLGGKWDNEAHYRVFQLGISICDFIAANGAELVAEYFRAFLALLDSERHNSAEAFYRARWHMKRIGELRKTMDAQAANEIANVMKDMDLKYNAQEKKYGPAVLSMMRAGKLPAIEISYGEGRAPAVESCENFMQMFRQQQMIASKNAAKPNDNSLTGFLKNLFKL